MRERFPPDENMRSDQGERNFELPEGRTRQYGRRPAYTFQDIQAAKLGLGAFACKWAGCQAVYRKRGDLVIHVNESHCGNTRPWVSQTCSWDSCWRTGSFNSQNHLICHLRAHTGEKPYRCGLCRKRFSVRSNFNAHCRARHNGQSVKLFVIEYDETEVPDDGEESGDEQFTETFVAGVGSGSGSGSERGFSYESSHSYSSAQVPGGPRSSSSEPITLRIPLTDRSAPRTEPAAPSAGSGFNSSSSSSSLPDNLGDPSEGASGFATTNPVSSGRQRGRPRKLPSGAGGARVSSSRSTSSSSSSSSVSSSPALTPAELHAAESYPRQRRISNRTTGSLQGVQSDQELADDAQSEPKRRLRGRRGFSALHDGNAESELDADAQNFQTDSINSRKRARAERGDSSHASAAADTNLTMQKNDGSSQENFAEDLSDVGSIDLEDNLSSSTGLIGTSYSERRRQNYQEKDDSTIGALIGMTERRNAQNRAQAQSNRATGSTASARSGGRGGRTRRNQNRRNQYTAASDTANSQSYGRVSNRAERAQTRQVGPRGQVSARTAMSSTNRGRRGQTTARSALEQILAPKANEDSKSDDDSSSSDMPDAECDAKTQAEADLHNIREKIRIFRIRRKALSAQRVHTQSLVDEYARKIEFFKTRSENPPNPLAPIVRAELEAISKRLGLPMPPVKISHRKIDCEKNLQECKRLHARGMSVLSSLVEAEQFCENAALELSQDYLKTYEKAVTDERENAKLIAGVPAADAVAAENDEHHLDSSEPRFAADSGATIITPTETSDVVKSEIAELPEEASASSRESSAEAPLSPTRNPSRAPCTPPSLNLSSLPSSSSLSTISSKFEFNDKIDFTSVTNDSRNPQAVVDKIIELSAEHMDLH